MKVLVLGGTGAMGVPVVEILAGRGYRVDVTTRKRRDNNDSIRYLIGDAHDKGFLEEILDQKYDAIIDFMVYTPQEFNNIIELLQNAAEQYLFISSARVYADSQEQSITENSLRLLDSNNDIDYLATNEYALAKAREEDILLKGKKRNFTIVRPYITYNNNRLQLGVYEKENWLQRAIDGKKIVLSQDIGERYTTLTYGYDVALRIADLIGCQYALGQIFNITTNQCIQWKMALEIYCDVLEQWLGKRPDVVWTESPNPLMEQYAYYQIHYDRLYSRRFNNDKIQKATGEKHPFVEPEEGLRKCLENFLSGNRCFTYRDWKLEATQDRLSGDRSNVFHIQGTKNKIKYLLYRYFIKM